MSNFLAIATVTETLRQMLNTPIGKVVAGATATAINPTGSAADLPHPGVNIYLYQVTPNIAWRNDDLPSRREDGTLIQRPRAALDLHYLLTFYGDDKQLEQQRLLGSVVRILHSHPLITKKQIKDAISAENVEFLSTSNLHEEAEQVKFAPIHLSLEELSKLWSVFFQTSYNLSIAYRASVVFVEGKECPQEALPVREHDLYVVPFHHPFIKQIGSQIAEEQPIILNQPILAGQRLVIQGKDLQGDPILQDLTLVRMGDIEVKPEEISPTQIILPLSSPPFPEGSLKAGVHSLQIVRKMMMGRPAVPHLGIESNMVAFVLSPTIYKYPNGKYAIRLSTYNESMYIDIKLVPKVSKDQRVILLLKELTAKSPAFYKFTALPVEDNYEEIVIPVKGVKNGEYLLRVQVDGAESPMDVDANKNSPTFNQYVGPKVTI